MQADNDERMALAILRQGELRLDAQLRLSLAADQRASTLAGMYTAVATALFGWIGWVLVNSDTTNIALSTSFLVTGLLFIFCACFCVYAVRPIDIEVPGSAPDRWISDGALERSLVEAYLKEASNYDRYISNNREAMKKNARALSRAIYLSVAAPLTGVLVYIIFSVCVS